MEGKLEKDNILYFDGTYAGSFDDTGCTGDGQRCLGNLVYPAGKWHIGLVDRLGNVRRQLG